MLDYTRTKTSQLQTKIKICKNMATRQCVQAVWKGPNCVIKVHNRVTDITPILVKHTVV